MPIPSEPKPHYIAFDPGEHTGYCMFDREGQIIENSFKTGFPELFRFLESMDTSFLKVVIVEEYRVRPDKQSTHSWSTIPTLRVIGALQYWAWRHGLAPVYQQPSDKVMGYKFAHAQPTKVKSLSHQLDAMAHGILYLQLHKIRKPMLPE